MKTFLENTKTIVCESIGVVGGFIWGHSTSWDYEPSIFLAVSIVGLTISLILIFLKQQALNPENTFEVDTINTNIDLYTVEYESKSDSFIRSITNISPLEIKESIRKSPPFQREDAASHFIGLVVRWNLELRLVFKRNNNNITVMMNYPSDFVQDIYFSTTTDEHPIFKISEDRKKFVILGKIINCKEFEISLDLISIDEV